MAVIACGAPSASSPPPPAQASAATPSATATAPAPITPGPPAARAITFLEDDYPRALAEARAKKVPLFVDAWAPWCHTCQSMRAYVFPDPKLAAYGDAFVWLAIDTEKEANEPFLHRFPANVLPTLWVIDPATERPALRWYGSATTPELSALLDDARRSVAQGSTDGEATASLLRAHQAAASGAADEAVREYRAALAKAPAAWPRRAQAVEALVTLLEEQKRLGECLDLASAELPTLPPGTSLANVAQEGLACASGLPKDDRRRVEGLRTFVAAVRRLAIDGSQPILADDRSGLFERLVSALDDEGKSGEAKEAAAQWATFLEGEAARARTPAARAVFDPHRLLAYLEIGPSAVAEKALPMLAASARDLPDDYNPRARMAKALLALGRNDEALAEIDHALSRVYGPRTLDVLSLKSDILVAKGDTKGAKATLRDAVTRADALPAADRYRRVRARLAQKLDALNSKR